MKISNAEAVGMSSSRLKRINDFSNDYINRGEIAGSLTLVARRGAVVHLGCHGNMSREAMQADTIFRIYSMTKPITTVAAMMLYERGSFDLETPISAFIPEFKDTEVFVSGTAIDYKTKKPQREITIRDLLTHTSGLTYDFLNLTVVDEMYRNANLYKMNLTDFSKTIAKMPLLFSPGTKWNYSVATDILGRIIEVISGLPLDKFFKQEIFEPLGMVDTDFCVPIEKQNRFAANYVHRSLMPEDIREKNPEKKLFQFDDPKTGQFSQPPILLSGGGGLVSTAADYLQFSSMLLNQGRSGNEMLLSPSSLQLMTTNHLPTDIQSYCFMIAGASTQRPGVGMGLGFSVNLDPAKAQIIGGPGEFGWSGAANTYFFIDPKAQLIAMFFTQLFPFDMSMELYRRFKVAVYQAVME